MIAHDFIYCKAETLPEAVEAFASYTAQGKRAFYYGGGSELITMSRANSIRPDVVIDYKAVPECRVLEENKEYLTIGAGLTLNEIKESKRFPLLGTAGGRVADHTNQCRITLGGNLCGTIRYREACLPLLLANAKVHIAAQTGARTVPLHDVFHERMRLQPGELAAAFLVPKRVLHAPYAHIKKTSGEKIDYPLINVTAMVDGERLLTAFSGVCAFPFRNKGIEDILNDASLPPQRRIKKALNLLPGEPATNAEGSGAYRLFLLGQTLENLLHEWESGALKGTDA